MGKRKHSLDSIRAMATKAGITLLSEKYINHRTTLKFSCSEGHEFEKSIKHILKRNTWCTKCTRSVAEELCRHVLETSLNVKFKKTWFEHKGHRLELDGYNENLKLAFEYNGKQHYEITPMTPTQESLELRKSLDKFKTEYCKENGIQLLIIPHTVPNIELKDHIGNELSIDVSGVNLEQFSNGYSYYRNKRASLESIISSSGGTLVQFQLDRATIQCSSGHTWNTKTYLIRNGHWCRKCISRKQRIATTVRTSYEDIAKRIGIAGIKCCSPSDMYTGRTASLEFECSDGHLFHDTAEHLLHRIENKDKSANRMACPLCLTPRQKMALEKIAKGGMKLINPSSYRDKTQILDWTCHSGHVQQNKLKNFMETLRRGNPLCRDCLTPQ